MHQSMKLDKAAEYHIHTYSGRSCWKHNKKTCIGIKTTRCSVCSNMPLLISFCGMIPKRPGRISRERKKLLYNTAQNISHQNHYYYTTDIILFADARNPSFPNRSSFRTWQKWKMHWKTSNLASGQEDCKISFSIPFIPHIFWAWHLKSHSSERLFCQSHGTFWKQTSEK